MARSYIGKANYADYDVNGNQKQPVKGEVCPICAEYVKQIGDKAPSWHPRCYACGILLGEGHSVTRYVQVDDVLYCYDHVPKSCRGYWQAYRMERGY